MHSPPSLRLVFMGTPDFAVPVLRGLKDAGHEIAAVYSQPPKPSGRGRRVRPSFVHEAAKKMGIAVRTPKTLRDADEQRYLRDLKPDAIVVVAYGLILPQPVLGIPRLGCLNIHFSLLPRWRGAAPVPRAILAGDKETGVDIMQMAAGLDTGDILMRETVPILPTSTTPGLLNDLARRGANLVIRTLADLAKGTLKPKPQASEGVTYAAKLTREDGLVDWNKPAADIERQLRALQPWPGCFFMLHEEPVKLLKAEIVTGTRSAPGTLLDKNFTIACGKDALRLLIVQRAGKNPADGASFLRGLRLSIGSKL